MGGRGGLRTHVVEQRLAEVAGNDIAAGGLKIGVGPIRMTLLTTAQVQQWPQGLAENAATGNETDHGNLGNRVDRSVVELHGHPAGVVDSRK